VKAPPITAVSLLLSDKVIRVAIGLRLGANQCAPQRCRCETRRYTRHARAVLFHSAGQHVRHYLINGIVNRALVRGGIAAVKEPNGLVSTSSLRPDGTTLIP